MSAHLEKFELFDDFESKIVLCLAYLFLFIPHCLVKLFEDRAEIGPSSLHKFVDIDGSFIGLCYNLDGLLFSHVIQLSSFIVDLLENIAHNIVVLGQVSQIDFL